MRETAGRGRKKVKVYKKARRSVPYIHDNLHVNNALYSIKKGIR